MEIPNDVRAFLEEPWFGVLATNRPGRPPLLTVMWYELRGDMLMVNSAAEVAKLDYIKEDPQVALCCEEGYKYVTVEGEVTELIDDQTIAQADIFALARRYNPDLSAEEVEKNSSYFKDQKRVTMLISIKNLIINGFDS